MTTDDHRPTLSFAEAEAMARRDGNRILQLDRDAVRYVEYDATFFHDYRKVSIEFDESGRGRMSFVMLPLAEREPNEHLTEEHIRTVAVAGKFLDAIRLYRLLHAADLATAKLAVEAMLQGT
jgi:hypothetical protein